MLSTSILSRPRGPKELFKVFAMDRAAMTVENIAQSQRIKRLKDTTNRHHFDLEYPGQTHDLRLRKLLL
jgi:hypothetical protein